MLRLGFVVAALGCAAVGGGEAEKGAEAVDLRTRGGEVLIAADEIVGYEWASHTLTLKPGLRKQLSRS